MSDETDNGKSLEQLAAEFAKDVCESIRQSIELGYTPTVFKQMIERYGAVEATKRLLPQGVIQSGFERLVRLNRIDLTMEYLVLRKKYRPLFNQELRKAAQWRIDQVKPQSTG